MVRGAPGRDRSDTRGARVGRRECAIDPRFLLRTRSPPDASATPPVIQINGANPAVIQVGASYSDLGATITGPQADLNLDIAIYLNGVAISPIALDTGTAATDTISYVVADQNGLTSTSTRSVIIEPAAAPPPATVATSSSATSTIP